VLTITLRDLQFRRRQFGIAVLGAAVVFGLTLLLTGMSAGLNQEIKTTVASVEADAWVVPDGIPGPFSSNVTLPAAKASAIDEVPGVRRAAPLVRVGHQAVRPDGSRQEIGVIGMAVGGLGGNAALPSRPGLAIVSDRLGVGVGDTIGIAGQRLRVEGIFNGASFFAGVPTVYLTLSDAQAIGFGGRPLANAIVTRGTPSGSLPAGLAARSPSQIETDLRTPVKNAISTIGAIRMLMWLVAALIIGAVAYLSAIDRVRDFAVLKAVGGASRTLAISLMLQAVLAALLAALIAVGLGRVMKPAVTVPVVFQGSAVLLLLAVAAVVGMLSSLVALRRAVSVDPALAFGG
jgi:putative ABC transport system permease protein